MLSLRVVLADRQQELTVQVPEDATIADVAAQVLQSRQQDAGTHSVRLIYAGRELRQNERVASVGCAGSVLHATVVERGQGSGAATRADEAAQPQHPAPEDWLDRVDPGTLLTYLCGGTLLVLWVLVLTSKYLFDLASIAILTSMTMAYVLPVLLGTLPLPDPVRTLLGLPQLHFHPGAGQGQPPPAGQGDRHGERARGGGGGSYTPEGAFIPPRPQARVRPGQALSEQQPS